MTSIRIAITTVRDLAARNRPVVAGVVSTALVSAAATVDQVATFLLERIDGMTAAGVIFLASVVGGVTGWIAQRGTTPWQPGLPGEGEHDQ